MNPIQTDPNPKNDSITEPPEMTPVTRFSHSSQEKKRSDNRRKAARYMQDLHRRNTVGDMLYMVGFWVEYVFVCVGRRVGAVVRGIGDTVLNLLLIVLRPILIGIITLIEDLTSPFVRMPLASVISATSPIPSWRARMAMCAVPRKNTLPAASENTPSLSGTPSLTYSRQLPQRGLWSWCAAAGAALCAECAGERRERRLRGERAGV